MKAGIDLGTTYSSVAVEIDGKIEMIKVATGSSAFGDSFSVPTAVFIEQGGILLGQAAFNKRVSDPSRFKSEFKRDFGTITPYLLGGEEYLPEQIYTEFFLYFKKRISEQIGQELDVTYITHPANYGNNKKTLLRKAAGNAGLFNVELVDEPTAVAVGYAQKNKISQGDILLVYDFGGGTFDVALIKKTEKGYLHLTEPLGISQCGGADFDRVIFDDVMQKLTESGRFDMDHLLSEKRFIAGLSETCIQIKHQLTQAESHTQPIAVGFDYFDYTITRDAFNNMIKPMVARTCEKLQDIIHNAGLSVNDIDKVLLVGGCSRVPLVRQMVENILGPKMTLDTDPELIISQGAVSIALTQEDEELQKRLEREEEARLQELQKQLLEQQKLEEEQKRAAEQRRTEETRRAEELKLRKAAEEREKVMAAERIRKNTGIYFRMRGMKDFIKETAPLTIKGSKVVIRIDDQYELEIPPNPTKFVELPSGEHQIFIYQFYMGMKRCKTLCTVHIKENEKYEVEVKIPMWAWDTYKLYQNNRLLNG